MNKIFLVIQREYLSRVKKPSFWILTLIVPILIAGLYAIPIILATSPLEHVNVLVADETGLFEGQFRSNDNITYHDAGGLEYAKRQLAEVDTVDAIVFIPAPETSIPRDAFLYYRTDEPNVTVKSDVDRQLQEILRNRILLDVHGITEEDYMMITSTHIKLRLLDLETGRDGFLEVKVIIGILLAFLIFMAVFMFGSQVMRGVMEEKNSRIVEVIICSVKPFHLMMGKVVGIGLVGITQFLMWLALSGVALAGLNASNADLFERAAQQQNMTQIATKGTDAAAQLAAAQQGGPVSDLIQGLTAINFPLIIGTFFFFFVLGYMLYATLFAAVGSLVDNETDSQQFTLPITIPLLLCMIMLPALINEPAGTLSTWLSIIPLTSPVAMMFRIPFGVPLWQMILSVVLLALTFPACIWIAAKIYRTGILRYGHKTTYRDLVKWLRK